MNEVTARNRAIVEDFVELFMRQLKVREAFEKHVADDYRQQNPAISPGRENAIRSIEALFASMPAPRIEVERILVDGNFAAVQLRARSGPGDPGIAAIDIFRIEHDQIAEHWEVVQPMPAPAAFSA